MLVIQEDYQQDSAVDKVLSVKECMEVFNLKDRKTVVMAIYTGKLIGRKLDSEPGQYRGTYIVDRDSAFALWGNRKDADNG